MNQQLLNINTVITPSIPINNGNNGNSGNSINSINDSINSIINNNITNSKYKITRYLGVGIKGNLYLAVDKNGHRYICKQILLNPNPANNKEETRQIEFELGILKYLSNNKNTREHINPCLEHLIYDNSVYTIFPVFNGYSIQHFYKYLSRMTAYDYYKILFFLIKSLLHALAKIHDTHIAHQNINENSILVSTFDNPREIKVKFTDFGLGCGLQVKYPNEITMDNTKMGENYNMNDNYFKISNCRENVHAPVQIDSSIIASLKDSDYLRIAQKWDILNLGLIFIKYLLYMQPLDIDYQHGYNKKLVENIKKIIETKYLSRESSKLRSMTVSNNIKFLILEYLKMINKYILVPTPERKTAQYILDKIIIFEKYKDDVF
jgi:serine/threonine protein kinase